jgi:hypothetical protein
LRRRTNSVAILPILSLHRELAVRAVYRALLDIVKYH